MLHPALVAGEPAVEHVRHVQYVTAQPGPLGLVLHGEHHLVAVRGEIAAVREDGRVPRAGALRRLPGQPGLLQRIGHPFGERVEQGHLDGAAAAGSLALQQRGQDAAVGVHAPGDVGDADPRLCRGVLRAGHGQHASLGLYQQVVRLAPGIGAVLAVAAQLARHQPWVTGHQPVGFQAEAPDRGGSQVADEHVGPRDERVECLPPRAGLQVEDHRLLGPVQPDEPAGESVAGGAVVVAGEVAAAGAFDLDDPRAKIGQVPRGKRSGHRLLQRHHEHPVQRAGTGNDLHCMLLRVTRNEPKRPGRHGFDRPNRNRTSASLAAEISVKLTEDSGCPHYGRLK